MARLRDVPAAVVTMHGRIILRAGPAVVYRDGNDWWVGYYRGSADHFVCPLPTLVIRWRRKPSKKGTN